MTTKPSNPTRSPAKLPEVGAQVLVHYLESPNAIRAKVVGIVTSVTDAGLGVKLTRPEKRGELNLERVQALELGDKAPPASAQSLPRWEPVPSPAA